MIRYSPHPGIGKYVFPPILSLRFMRIAFSLSTMMKRKKRSIRKKMTNIIPGDNNS